MTTRRDPSWHDVDELLDRALDLGSDERVAWVEHVITEDPRLGAELKELLGAVDGHGPLDAPLGTLLGPGFTIPDVEGGDERGFESRRVGAYRITSLLGQGGMGRVFAAERADGVFEQSVALKVLRWEAASPEARDRFRRERQLLAQLDHPGIARLLDGGVTEDGLPYLVMERVDGRPIDRYCAEDSVDLRMRARLVRDVCTVVDYAHRNFVVHRDLKPSNIHVAPDGTVRLLDFGVAKLLSADDMATMGAAPLTPSYAAPEQVAGGPITAATDVYALGVLLCELSTGRRPHEADGPTRAELARRIASDDPPIPSDLAVANTGPVRPGELRGDIDSIVLKALARDPIRRYQSARELEDDLDAWLDHRPVAARNGGSTYRLRRFVRRYRGTVVAAGLVALSLAAGLGFTLQQSRRADAERDLALAEAERAARVADVMTELFGLADPFATSSTGDISARELLGRGAEQITTRLAGDTATMVSALLAIGEGYRRLGAFQEARTQLEPALGMARAGGDPLLLSDALAGLGRLEADRGAHEAAESLLTEALELRMSARTARDLKQADLYGGLTNLRLALEDADGADSLNAAQARLLADLLPDTDRRRFLPVIRDAHIDRIRGDLEAAEAGYEGFLMVARDRLDDDDELWATALNNLGFVRRLQGDHSGAEEAYLRSVSQLERTAGPGYPLTVRVRANLAGVYSVMDRIADAEGLLVENVDAVRQSAPGDRERIGRTLTALSGGYIVWRNWPAADRTVREALALWRDVSEPDPVVVELLRLRLAIALEFQGKEAEASALREDAQRILSASGDPLSFSGLGTLDWMAAQYEANGREDLATWHHDLRTRLAPAP